MTITLPHAPSVRSHATRAFGQATVLMRRGGGLTAAASALVTPYVAGTDTPYPGALYAGPDASTPLVFPVATGEDGVVELWADAPARIDLEAVHPTWGANRVTLDLEPAPSAVAPLTDVTITAPDGSLTVAEAPPETFSLAVRLSPDAGNTLALHAGGLFVPPPPERATLLYRHSGSTTMADPGPGYARSNATGAAVTALAFDVLTDGNTDATPLLRVLREGDSLYVQDKDDATHWARFVVDGTPLDQTGWFEVPVAYVSGSGTSPGNNERVDVTFTMAPPQATAPVDAYSKSESDARYPLKTDPDPYPQYLTAGEVPPSDVTVSVDGSLSATEAPANTFALAVKLSPDAGNALALRGNGLYGTDTTGAGGDFLPLTGGTLTGPLVLQAVSTGTTVAQAKVAGDAVQRLRVAASGRVEWTNPTSGAVIAAAESTGTGTLQVTGNLSPAVTASQNMGLVSNRWDTLYAGGVDVTGTLAGADATFLRLGATGAASAGAVRLRTGANGQIAWRNAAGSGNLVLTTDAGDQLSFNGTPIPKITVAASAPGSPATGDLWIW